MSEKIDNTEITKQLNVIVESIHTLCTEIQQLKKTQTAIKNNTDETDSILDDICLSVDALTIKMDSHIEQSRFNFDEIMSRVDKPKE